jgi:GGDEF domain-containing protein
MTHYALSGVTRIISDLVRRTDLIIDQATESDRLIIFCPETSGEQASLMKRRILATTKDQIDVRVCVGMATFPDEALTFEELVRVADDKLACELANPILIEEVELDNV